GRAGGAGAIGAAAMIAAARLEMLLVAIVDQCVQVGHNLDDDIAAAAAIPTIRPAELDELLAPEADAAGAAVTRLHEDLGLVEEFHDRDLSRNEKGNGGFAIPLPQTRGREWLRRLAALRFHSAAGRAAASGFTETVVRPPVPVWKATRPSAL